MTKEELEKDFYKYLKDSSDYYDPREPLTERKLLQMWLDCAEPREKHIAELEAQIAELKLKLEALEGQTPWKDIKDKSEVIGQLTKAKEIIRALLKHTYGQNLNTQNDFDLYLGRIKEAEQFLKEVEK